MCCSFLKANFVIGFLCAATLPESLFLSSVSQTNCVGGSQSLTELDVLGVGQHLTVEKSATESVFCVWFKTVMCFFPAAWIFNACPPMLDSEKVFAHSLHFAFVLSSATDLN